MPVKVAFLAPTPPPVMGPSVATQIVLSEPPPPDLQLLHIDTADRRSLGTLGRVDLKNLWDAFSAYGRLFGTLVARHPHLVYIPVSQTTIGFLRDAGHIALARLFGRRVLLHLRGGYFRTWYEEECGRLMKAFVRFWLRRTHGVIVLGESLRALFQGLVPDERIHVVPNGDDYPELRGTERTYGGRRGLQVLFLGNLIPTKGPGDLLRAAPAVLRRHPATRFVFAGAWRDEAFRAWALRFVEEHGLGDRVAFVGPVDRARKVELLRESDLFAFPTYYRNEGHPWVIVEALAAGLPVVSTDHGCIRECVHDGRNGRLVAKRDPDALARAVSDLLDRPEDLERMARASRDLHEERFTRTRFREWLFAAMRRTASGEGER